MKKTMATIASTTWWRKPESTRDTFAGEIEDEVNLEMEREIEGEMESGRR